MSQLVYERAEAHQRIYEMQLRRIQDKYSANQQRRERRQAETAAAARRLVDAVRQGQPTWPAAFSRPEFAGATNQIELILADWPGASGSTQAANARAIAAIASQLRTELAQRRETISHLDRVRAMQTVRQLDYLAVEGSDASVAATPSLGGEADPRLSHRGYGGATSPAVQQQTSPFLPAAEPDPASPGQARADSGELPANPFLPAANRANRTS
jgi:hypothetical protein